MCMCNLRGFCFVFRFYLFMFREKVRGRERERNIDVGKKHQSVASRTRPDPLDQQPKKCPGGESNPPPFVSGSTTPSRGLQVRGRVLCVCVIFLTCEKVACLFL